MKSQLVLEGIIPEYINKNIVAYEIHTAVRINFGKIGKHSSDDI